MSKNAESSRCWSPTGNAARKILDAVFVLHQRGYEQLRVYPSASPSGVYWRIKLSTQEDEVYKKGEAFLWSTGSEAEVAGEIIDRDYPASKLADVLLQKMPWFGEPQTNEQYAAWYRKLIRLVEEHETLPVAYAEYMDESLGWEIGWGSKVFIKHPPPPIR